MPQTALPNVGVNYEYTLGTSDWKNGNDTSLVVLDMMAQPFVIDQRTAEPGSPVVGDAYLLTGSPTGTNWGSDTGAVADSIALFTNVPGQTDGSPWFYITPSEGFELWDRALNRAWLYIDGAWENPRDVEAVTGATFEPTLKNGNGVVLINNAAHTLNIPDNATVPYAIGTRLRFLNQDGANAITVTDDAAVTYATGSQNLVSAGIAAGAQAEILKTGTDEWFVLLNQALP